ncbi:MAG: hypothetical protein J6A45_06500 [Lachnospiraceae bacterium]|nr:hypothetical protein [Lachnospiraceae bacterium]
MIIWLITGLWILLGCAEAAHLITIMTNRSLQTYTVLFSVFVLAGLLAYTGLCIWFYRKNMAGTGTGVAAARASGVVTIQRSPYMVCFVILAGVTVYHFMNGYVPDLQDAVYEITLGNVASGSIMTVHPFLGSVTEASMPMRMQILSLSSLYSALITISQQSPYIIMCKVVPLVIWGLSILLYYAFAKDLFPENVHKRWIFISMVALVYLATSGSTGLAGQRLFYAGFSGESIRAVLLMPYTVYVSWQKKWHLAVLAVLAEACLVWTTFGVGYCFLIAACMFMAHLWADRRGAHAK